MAFPLFFGPMSPWIALLIVALAAYGFTKLRTNRRKFTRLLEAGLDMPPGHSFLWGHLQQVGEAQKPLPPGAAADYSIANMAKAFPDGIFCLDTWPFSMPLLVISTPKTANALQKYNATLDKPDDVRNPLDTLCAGPGMITLEEKMWKPWRALFNPSFSSNYLLQLAPSIAREIQVFCDILREKAREGKAFELESLAARLTIDVIGKTSLDTRLCHQRKDNPLALVLRRHVEWIAFNAVVEPWKRLNPFRPLILRYNNRLLKRYIGEELDQRFVEARAASVGKTGGKSIVSLALNNYLASSAQAGQPPKEMDENFKAAVTSNLILFMLAGHDTTSTTICLAYHCLATHPEALARTRAEHDEVFGRDTSLSQIMSIIDNEPERLNRLTYTLAVAKETLRLYPPVSGIRWGSPSVTLADDSGKSFPTAGFKIWTNHAALHRNPRYWPDPDRFIPERWLAKEGDPLHPVKGAWRPFEHGARNCIGQTLALMEIKMVLLMTVREFEVEPAFAEEDGELWGSKAFVVDGKGLGNKPCKGYPVKVRYAERN